MYTLTKDGVTMQLTSEIQVAAFLKSGWKESGRPLVQEVVLPDPPEIKDVTTAETATKRRRATRKAK